MDLVTMRTQFKRHCSGLADSMSDPDIDEYLNSAYTGLIPSDVDGDVSRVEWVEELIPDLNFLAVPSRIASIPSGRCWIKGYAGSPTLLSDQVYNLSLYDSMEEFQSRYPSYLSNASTGRPSAMVMIGRAVFFDMPPDQPYYFHAEARGAGTDSIPSVGIDDYVHCLCIITSSAWIYLLEREDEAGAAREGGQYEIYKGMLLARSTSGYQHRFPARSF